MKPHTATAQSKKTAGLRRIDSQTRWLIWLAVALVVVSSVPLSLYAVLWRAGETASLPKIADKQLALNGLYGTAIHDDTAHYKLALFEAVRPDIVAIGSSRVMQFRGEAFSTSFVNLGGTVKGLSHAEELLPHIFSLHHPKLILFGLDFWWFNDVRKPRSSWLDEPSTRDVSARKLPFALESLVDGKMSLDDITQVLKGANETHIGLQAILRNDGFDRYGSYHYSSTITGAKPHFDAQFANILGRVREGSARFEWGDQVSPERWRRLLAVLDTADRAGVPIIMLLPPVAPSVADRMIEQKTYGLIDDLTTRLSRLDRPYFDYHDTRSLGAGNCAFIDGDHGGDILYAVMASQMETHTPELGFDWVNEALVKEVVKSNPESATARQWRYSELPEVDFLQLGCR